MRLNRSISRNGKGFFSSRRSSKISHVRKFFENKMQKFKSGFIGDDKDDLRNFVAKMDERVKSYGYQSLKNVEKQNAVQKEQVDRLLDFEDKWRLALWKDYELAKDVYYFFGDFILNVKRNILSARPYFRERQKKFTANMASVFKTKDFETLQPYSINFPFIALAMQYLQDKATQEVKDLFEQVKLARTELVEMNLPLVVSRSRLFWSKNKASEIGLVEFIQIATEGLLSAIDKFVPPYTPVFRSVAISRMGGNMIEANSNTMVHLYPLDMRILYRVRKYYNRFGGTITQAFMDAVNEDLPEKDKATEDDVVHLLAAASTVSSDSRTVRVGSSAEVDTLTNSHAAPEDVRPDLRYEEIEVRSKLKEVISKLPIIDQKLLTMKGIRF